MIKVNGTLMNYYFHCKRQCYLLGNRLNLEDNSELVQIGRAIHEEKSFGKENSEITIENIRIDKLTSEYLVEIKKSDADVEACKWQLLFYLSKLREKGIERKGKLEFSETNNTKNKIVYYELTEEIENQIKIYIEEIENLIEGSEAPEVLNSTKCRKCAYYEYCYI